MAQMYIVARRDKLMTGPSPRQLAFSYWFGLTCTSLGAIVNIVLDIRNPTHFGIVMTSISAVFPYCVVLAHRLGRLQIKHLEAEMGHMEQQMKVGAEMLRQMQQAQGALHIITKEGSIQ